MAVADLHAMTSPLHLLLVDDHAMVREGLTRILERAGSDWQIQGASSAFEALDVMRHREVDVAIVDLSMPGMSGLDLIRRIHAEFPRTRVLVLSMHAEEQYAMRAFKAGASGYVTKDRAAGELVGALRKVAAGGTYVSDSLAELAVRQLNREQASPRHADLTDRELEVFKRIAAGDRLTDIALALNVSIKTVSTHKSRIQEKLGLASTAALIRYGMEQQLAPGTGGVRHEAAPAADVSSG